MGDSDSGKMLPNLGHQRVVLQPLGKPRKQNIGSQDWNEDWETECAFSKDWEAQSPFKLVSSVCTRRVPRESLMPCFAELDDTDSPRSESTASGAEDSLEDSCDSLGS